MSEKLYPIKINKTGRYLVHCDEHWYETDSAPAMKFTEQECNALVKQLKNHYVYDVTIEGLTPSVEVKPTEVKTVKKGSIAHLKELMKKK